MLQGLQITTPDRDRFLGGHIEDMVPDPDLQRGQHHSSSMWLGRLSVARGLSCKIGPDKGIEQPWPRPILPFQLWRGSVGSTARQVAKYGRSGSSAAILLHEAKPCASRHSAQTSTHDACAALRLVRPFRGAWASTTRVVEARRPPKDVGFA